MGARIEEEKFQQYHDANTLVVWYLDFIGDQQRWPSVMDTFQIKSTGVTHVGRAVDESECVLADVRVSRKHASIEVVEQGLIVTDLGSVNGTFINGERVTQPSALCAGDRVTFDRLSFRVRRSLNVPDLPFEEDALKGVSFARQRLIQARRERLASEGRVNVEIDESKIPTLTRPVKSRYHSYLPVIMGSCAAMIVAGLIVLLL